MSSIPSPQRRAAEAEDIAAAFRRNLEKAELPAQRIEHYITDYWQHAAYAPSTPAPRCLDADRVQDIIALYLQLDSENRRVATALLEAMLEGLHMTPRQKAEDRIAETPELGPYRDLLLRDWPDADNHLQWVASADTENLIAWAREVRATGANA